MIGFFRRIRKKLADQNQVLKYSRYAIGEIFLVVIGILIALQVNNWNEKRKREQAEIQLYHKIIDDLNSELAVIERKIRTFKAHQNLHFQLYNESLGEAEYNPTTNYKDLYLYSPAHLFFNENHSKSLPLITDVEIHNLLKKYIDQENIATTGNNEWNEIKTEKVRPFLAKHGIKNTKEVYNVDSLDDWNAVGFSELISYPKLMEQYDTVEFNQILFELRIYTTWTLHHYNLLKNANREFKMFLKNKNGMEQITDAQGLSLTLLELLLEDKTVDEIIVIVKDEDPENLTYDISETGITNFGYSLIDERQLNDAKKIFELGIELYPDAYNLHDSYGECLIKLMDYENATKAFERALELNPESANSKRLLEFLREKGY